MVLSVCEIFQVICDLGRFSRHNICVASEKRGRGEEKGGEGKKKEGKGKKKGERGRKKGERGRKKLCREGKRVFSKVLGKVFNNVMS